MTASALMKKGKATTAAFVLSECKESTQPQVLNQVLDTVLNPHKGLNELETVEWCKWLMAGGVPPDDFAAEVMLYDNSSTCGLVWTANFVAYRCRTCGISPCMSLCADCFQKGNHEGHDFNMFRSQAGGACDCGDTSVMKESGFCDRHGPQAQLNKAPVPKYLLTVADEMMPRIILRLIQHLRENSMSESLDTQLNAVQAADSYLDMLRYFCTLGAAMRRVMTRALINPLTYKTMTQGQSDDPEVQKYLDESERLYHEALKTLPNPEIPPGSAIPDCLALQDKLVHQTFLDELMFWTVKYEFPQSLVCFLLNMLPDRSYKMSFTRTFVLHYSRISVLLVRSSDTDMLSNRVVHVSVQLFSNEALAMRMVSEMHLLHVMVVSLQHMMQKILIQSVLHDPEKNMHKVVDCSRHVMKDHCYWPLVSDLNNVLSHAPVALKFMSDDNLLQLWFNFLTMLQGMNVNQRELGHHVEFEPNTYYAAFSAELEASASPLWALLSHLKDNPTVYLTQQVLRHCMSALIRWFNSINFVEMDIVNQVDPFQVSFHLPLHRYYALFMIQAINKQGVSLKDVLPSPDILHLLFMHPLRLQVAFYEILSGLWVRNGLQIKGQAMTYIQCHFCNSMVDADLYLLQICATQLSPRYVLLSILDRFHIYPWMSLGPYTKNTFLEPDQEIPMLESFLSLLLMIVGIRTNLGLAEPDLSRLEMITLLCMGDKTHSQLMELMPEKCGTGSHSKEFENILSEIAKYHQPDFEVSGSMQQGMYSPLPVVWDEMYDPVYVLLRAVHRRDFQTSMDRYCEYVRSTGKYKKSSAPWPPFIDPHPCNKAYEDPRKLLCTGEFHAMLFVILYKSVHTGVVSEHVLSLVVNLLEKCIAYTKLHEEDLKREVCEVSQPSSSTRRDMQFNKWFETDWLSANLRTEIDKIALVRFPATNSETSDEDIDSDGLYNDSDAMEVGEITEPSPMIEFPPLHLSAVASPMSTPNAAHGALVPVSHYSLNGGGSTYTATSPAQPLALMAGTEMVLASVSPAISPSASSGSGSPPNVSQNGNSSALVVSTSHAGAAANGELVISHLVHKDRKVVKKAKQDFYYDKEGDSDMQTISAANSATVEIPIGESIISLLMKLHSKLSGTQGSYEPISMRVNKNLYKGKVGDGPFFVGKVLDSIANLDVECEQFIQDTREKIWSTNPTEPENLLEKEILERELKSQRAKERQRRMMAHFRTQQQMFMEHSMETGSYSVECDDFGASTVNEESNSTLLKKKEYDCVICNQSSPSTEDHPMGSIVLLQATSVLSHQRKTNSEITIPTTEEDKHNFRQPETLGIAYDRRIEELKQHFAPHSWLLSLNIGWEGGVHVQTCGHHLHLSCLKSYQHSLRSQNRVPNVAADRGEYPCPVCRQLSNSMLPISPDMGSIAAIVKGRSGSMKEVALELHELLKNDPPSPNTGSLLEAMGKTMEDMSNITYPKYRQKANSEIGPSLFLFVSSIARTNLEMEIIQRGGTLLTQTDRGESSRAAQYLQLVPKRSCFVPLLHVLAAHSKILHTCSFAKLWTQVVGNLLDDNSMSVTVYEKEVPLLLRDMTSLLIQLVLTLPLYVDLAFYTCIVKALFNVVYFQVLAQISCKLTDEAKDEWKRQGKSLPKLQTLASTLGLVITALENGQLYLGDADYGDQDADKLLFNCSEEGIEQKVQHLCLPFLRIAALLRHYIYEEDIALEGNEFSALCHYLEIVNRPLPHRFSCSLALNWIGDEDQSVSIIKNWCEEFMYFVGQSQIAARSLLDQHITWHPPRLLALPENYSSIFQFYHLRVCCQCNSAPKEPSICLLCSALVCLRENCCRKQNIHEAVQHSVDCGAGTGIFLAVNSSTIIVVRGKRACLWGSVYLDSFGEEDRELKRGKPLFLSKQRYELLQQQWLRHRFDHTNKKWIWHRDAL